MKKKQCILVQTSEIQMYLLFSLLYTIFFKSRSLWQNTKGESSEAISSTRIFSSSASTAAVGNVVSSLKAKTKEIWHNRHTMVHVLPLVILEVFQPVFTFIDDVWCGFRMAFSKIHIRENFLWVNSMNSNHFTSNKSANICSK
jgi:hypothetical protein